MLLKGILLILIGISGIAIIMTWIFKSFNRVNINKSNISRSTLEDSYYTTGVSDIIEQDKNTFDNNLKSLEFYLQRQEEKSTILLDDFIIDKETVETVLLEEEKSKL